MAEQSQQSASKISQLIVEIQSQTDKAVEAMSKGTREVESGVQLVNDTGAKFKQIQRATQHVDAQIQEVSSITEEMSAGFEQVSASIHELSRISNESSIGADRARIKRDDKRF